ncbi:hypothetical protein DIPPA_00538 [Diplonema papillatum]|nr:hypothetical protein DIPPA_00538 [Diplonema papillatum]
MQLNEEATTTLLDLTVAARTRAQLAVKQNSGERLRDAEDSKLPCDLEKQARQESQDYMALISCAPDRRYPPLPGACRGYDMATRKRKRTNSAAPAKPTPAPLLRNPRRRRRRSQRSKK